MFISGHVYTIYIEKNEKKNCIVLRSFAVQN